MAQYQDEGEIEDSLEVRIRNVTWMSRVPWVWRAWVEKRIQEEKRERCERYGSNFVDNEVVLLCLVRRRDSLFRIQCRTHKYNYVSNVSRLDHKDNG